MTGSGVRVPLAAPLLRNIPRLDAQARFTRLDSRTAQSAYHRNRDRSARCELACADTIGDSGGHGVRQYAVQLRSEMRKHEDNAECAVRREANASGVVNQASWCIRRSVPIGVDAVHSRVETNAVFRWVTTNVARSMPEPICNTRNASGGSELQCNTNRTQCASRLNDW